MHTVYYISLWIKPFPEKENNVCTTFRSLYIMGSGSPGVFDTGNRQ